MNYHISPKYRPDIDGLRAISILAVVGFHVSPRLIPGGFIGVDIFFVISGYLISTIIMDSLERNSFSFVSFYIRRIIRIFPALLFVLFVCYIFGWFVLLPEEFKQLGKHVAGGAVFVPNFLLWIESGYFDNSAKTKPLLHLWSLGIEEQFYLVWPLLLWFAWKQRLNLLTVTFLFMLISFVLNINIVNDDQLEAGFYSPQTRFWELLMGSVLAYFMLHKHAYSSKLTRLEDWFDRKMGPILYEYQSNPKNTLHNLQSLLGAILIVISIFLISKEKAFPGWWALMPTSGALLIISAGEKAWLNRVVLSHRILVWFGLISFPLYLWHWPLISFSHILESRIPSREIRISSVLIAVVLAWLTYRLIEKPIKFVKRDNVKTFTLFFLMVFIGCVGYVTFENNGYSSRLTKGGRGIPDWWPIDPKVVNINSCQPAPDVIDSWCRTTGNPTVALLGDSHSDQLMERFIQNGNPKFSKIISMGAGNCQPLTLRTKTRCVRQIKHGLDFVLAADSIQYVILTSWNMGVVNNLQPSIDGYRETFNILRRHNKKMVFIVDIPTLKENPKACIDRDVLPFRSIFQPPYPKFCNGAGPNDIEPRNEYNKLVEAIKKENLDVLVYDPLPNFCRKNICKVKEGAVLYYNNKDHLSPYGLQPIVDDLIKKIETHFPN